MNDLKTEVEMADLAERVENDTDRQIVEKETTISAHGNEDVLHVFAAKKTVVKSLLKHNHFDLDWAEGGNEDYTSRYDADEIHEADAIYAVSGTMPLGVLTVKSKPRSQNNISSVVNHKTVDPDAFE